MRLLKGAAIALAALIVVAALALAVRHWRNAADPDAARGQVGRSLELYRAGDMSGARAQAAKAVRNKPDWGLAHALLARLYLATGDGAAAQSQLDLATANGFSAARLHQLYADAALLQGDADRALAEAARALPRYAGYATRVRARALAAQGDLPQGRATLEALLAADSSDAGAWLDLARLRSQSGDVAGAIGAVDRALALTRLDAGTLRLKGELVRGQYGLVAALPWFDAALAVDPGDADTLLDKAATLGDLGRYQDMLATTRQVLAARPGDPMAYYLQAVLAARAGNDDLARDLMARTDGALDDMPGAELLGGILDYANGADQQAIDKWRALSGAQPYNATARRLLGTALLRSGDADGALDALRPLALRGDADSYTLTLAARAFEAEGKRDWAAKLLDRAADPSRASPAPFGSDGDLSSLAAAADAAPGDPVAGADYIRGLMEAGRMGTALGRAQAIAQASPGSPDAQLVLGDTLWAMNRLPEATSVYRRAANLRFDQPTMLRLVDALDRTGARDAAQQALALYLSQNPQDVAARRLAAHWQVAAGDWHAALATLEGLRQTLGDRDATVLGELALAYAGTGDGNAAVRYGAAAYRLAPMNPAICDAYGRALATAGNRDGARQLLIKAASLAPNDPQIRGDRAALES
ncbi:MAG: tetratricopeptide repeat protein [Sphingomonas sp.]